jgi:hypothetical protein
MNNLTQPAYPVVPLQDNFKRLVVPIPGLSKLEYFALKIFEITYNKHHKEFKQDCPDENLKDKIIMEIAIDDAIDFLNMLEEKTKTLTNDKDSEMAIFNH